MKSLPKIWTLISVVFTITFAITLTGCKGAEPTVYPVNLRHEMDDDITADSHAGNNYVEDNTKDSSNETNIESESSSDLEQGYEPGMVFPDFQMKDADGNTVNLSDYRGKALYLNFFTTWCVYCYYEMPDLAEVQKKYEDNLQVLLVDIGENAELAKEYADTYGISFNINHIPDWNVGTHIVEGVPESFVIDKNGVIVDYTAGMAKYEWMDAAVSNAVTAE